MKREEKLFEVLKALAVSSKKALTISTIIKKANYTNHKFVNQALWVIQWRIQRLYVYKQNH